MPESEAGPIQYPVDSVVAVLDRPEQVRCALDALAGPFLESEIGVACGEAQADRMRASTGRSGLADGLLRVARSIGIANDELEVKGEYEQALRDGLFVLNVLAPTEERKKLAAEALRSCGGHFINYFGRLTRERLYPWKAWSSGAGSVASS